MKTILIGIAIIIGMAAILFATPAYAPCMGGPGINCNNYPPQTLTQIKSDMLNYVNSDKPVITIIGIPHVSVHLEIDDSSSNIIFEHDIIISPYGNANYTLGISSYKPDVYSITATSLMSKITTSFAVGLMPAGHDMIILNTNKDTYVPGDSVVILGAYQPNAIYQISLVDPNGAIVKTIQAFSNETGHFLSSDLKIPSNAISGTWKISASSGLSHETHYITIISQNLQDATNNVEIQNIQVQPSTVKVGDAFTVTTTLVNNSPVPIELYGGTCSIKATQASFATVMFDSHAKIKAKNVNCAGADIYQILNPGKNIMETSPDFTSNYIATESGTANLTVSFSYSVKNQTDSSQPNIVHAISKSLLFTILENNTGTKTISEITLSPLKQFKSGIQANNVICREDLQLLVENPEGFPICVKLSTVPNLLHQDWSYPSNCKYEQSPFTAGVGGLIMIEKNASNPSSKKSYFPQNSTVVIGWNNTVSWINYDNVSHTVTSNWNLFDSGPILPGADWQHDFECAGNYWYHSEPHPWMKGWIRVLPPGR